MMCDEADAYELRYGEKKFRDTDRLHFGRDVKDGCLLTACAPQMVNSPVYRLSK